MSLPIDVVNHILAFNSDQTSKPSKICAEGHPILSKLSERYIYANVTLHDDHFNPSISRISEFSQILAKSPDIANYVRSLKMICVDGGVGSKQYKATSSHLNGVASLLPVLSGITSFTVTIEGHLDAKKCHDFFTAYNS
jgi:hypothetical protein